MLIKFVWQASTSSIEALQPVGIMMLRDVIEHFAHALDPEAEGVGLLEQYQAQIGALFLGKDS